MNRNLIIIYALIMLECRLSFEDASRIFRVDINTLKEALSIEKLGEGLYTAIEYLEYEVQCYPLDNKRGLFKARIYMRKLRQLLMVQDKDLRHEKLKEFINDLKGPSVVFILEKDLKCRYTEEEKNAILKYRLKFAKSGMQIKGELKISHEAILKWEEELPDSELKTRLEILRGYLNYIYTSSRSNK